MGGQGVKRKPERYVVDFVTALAPSGCRERLERSDGDPLRGLGRGFTPVTQRVLMLDDDLFTIERYYPGALVPIRFVGHLDPKPEGGAWVHGAVTHDVDNQVLIEGWLLFALFFLMTVLFYVRLRVWAFAVSLPVLALLWVTFAARWRVLRRATEDISRWLRQRLYLTEEQVRRG